MTSADPAAFCSLFPGLSELAELYRELDREIARFKRAVALDCPEFCRTCCTAAEEQIEVSVFECLPVSLHLWGRGEGESCLQRIAANGGNNLCVLYTRGTPFCRTGDVPIMPGALCFAAFSAFPPSSTNTAGPGSRSAGQSKKRTPRPKAGSIKKSPADWSR